MGARSSRSGRNRSGYIPSKRQDTAILVQSDTVSHNEHAISCEEIAMELNGKVMGLKFTGGIPPSLDSPSDCTTLSTISTVTAHPLDQKHRYHLFFAYHPSNEAWVDQMVRKLEDAPYDYKCCFAKRDFDERVTHVQNILCCVMLSQRIIMVLSPAFIRESWPEYEDNIAHLTSLSQRRQRVVTVMFEPCDIPESLKMWQPIDANNEGFMENLFRSLQVGFHNGQVLTTINGSIEGFCKSKLLFDYEEVPDSLIGHDICLSRQEYAEVIKMVGCEDNGAHLSWLFSALPSIVLGITFILWCISFILVIILFPDDIPSTLPVRLCVFCLPATVIVFGCIYRWKKLKHSKEKFAMCMFSRSVQVNKSLYEKSKPVIITTARSHDDSFHIYFVYFEKSDCIERIKMFLTHCTDDELFKLSKLIEVYTLSSSYSRNKPIAAGLAIMMSSAYAINLIYKRIPHTLEQRHTRRRQCLCQFVEEFLAVYLPSLRQEADLTNLRVIFTRYLNCQLKPDPIVLHTLGICHIGTSI